MMFIFTLQRTCRPITLKLIWPILCLLFITPAEVFAINKETGFAVRLGYLVGNSETDIRLDKKGYPAGLLINTEDTLGMDTRATTPRIDLLWQYEPNHRLELTWFNIRRKGTKILEEELQWGDTTYPIGARLESELDTNVLRAGYSWSFYQSDKAELGIGAGLYVMGIRASFAGETLTSPREEEDASVTAPLPVASLYMGYKISNDWRFDLRSDFFALEVGDYTGSFTDHLASLSYKLTDRLTFGAGLNSNRINVTADDGDYKLRLSNDVIGVSTFLSYRF